MARQRKMTPTDISDISAEIRKLVYTTNSIENFNRQLRKVTKSRTIFPTDNALFKILYLAMMDITKKWTGKSWDWVRLCISCAYISGIGAERTKLSIVATYDLLYSVSPALEAGLCIIWKKVQFFVVFHRINYNAKQKTYDIRFLSLQYKPVGIKYRRYQESNSVSSRPPGR